MRLHRFFVWTFAVVAPLAVQAQNIINTVAGGSPKSTPTLITSMGEETAAVQDSTNGDGGPAAAAQLNGPKGVATDRSGNFFIADTKNCVVRKVAAATGFIQTIAGTMNRCGFGGDQGSATAAQLNAPTGIFVDHSGNLFIADTKNCVIRKVAAATQIIQTVAGVPGSCGFAGDGSAATSAQLNAPTGLFVDRSGNLFIADTSNHAVREVAAATSSSMNAGNIYTTAGNGTPGFSGDHGSAASAQLNEPQGLFIDGSGNLFIADSGNNSVREVPAKDTRTMGAGLIYTVAGNGRQGLSLDGTAATSAELKLPTSMVVDSAGNLFIADAGNALIRKVPAVTVGPMITAGDIYTVAGGGTGGDGGPALNAALALPWAIAEGPSGSLLIADADANLVRSVASLMNAPTGTLSTTSLAFTAQTVGTPSSPQVVTITNNGTSPLTFVSFIFGGTNSTEFSGSSTCGTTLAVGRSCGIAIAFKPAATGTKSAALTITDDAPDSPQTVTLSGVGVTGTPAVTLSSTSLVFGAQVVGATTAAQVVTLTNTGTSTLNGLFGTFGGANPGDFPITSTCGGSLVAGGSCTYSLAFRPSGTGARAASLMIVDDAADSPQTITLGGVGVTLPGATLSTTSLTFGAQTIGTTSAAQVVTLTNTGTATLNIATNMFNGPNPYDFFGGTTCGATLAAGRECGFTLLFRPLGAGPRTISLLIVDDAPDSPQTVTLSGVGMTTSVGVAGNGAGTQTVRAGQTATYNLQLSTGGGGATDQASATITCAGAPARATCIVPPAAVTATSTTPGTFTVTVTTTGSSSGTALALPQAQPPATIRLLSTAILMLLFSMTAMLTWRRSSAGRPWTRSLTFSACMLLAIFSETLVQTGCGSGQAVKPPPVSPTPPGTYALTITATSGTNTQTTALTLVVQ